MKTDQPRKDSHDPYNTDEWKVHDGYLVRIHINKRLSLFTPLGLRDSPKLPEEFTGKRITKNKFTDTYVTYETAGDFNGSMPHQSLGYTWTCETWFELKRIIEK